MTILLDTHILLWSLADTKKIHPNERAMLLSAQNNICVSTISLWEISLKYQFGKLELRSLSIEDIVTGIEQSGYMIITLTAAEAISFYKLPRQVNTDPFDRLLAWQAICQGYYLMSRDKKLEAYKEFGLQLI